MFDLIKDGTLESYLDGNKRQISIASGDDASAADDANAAADAENMHDSEDCPANKVINSVGQLTRQLHDTLAELGYDRTIQDAAAAALPDARQRIAYVVKLTADGDTQTKTLHSGSSYLSASELVLTFGLGQRDKADSIEVRWPSGQLDRLPGAAAGATLSITEAKGITATRRFGSR